MAVSASTSYRTFQPGPRLIDGNDLNYNIGIEQTLVTGNAVGYTKVVPTAGQTINVPNNGSVVSMAPAGTLATLTVVTPPNPVDGQRMSLWTTQTITALTITASPGQTINGAVTTLTANSGASYVYSASNSTWDRVA